MIENFIKTQVRVTRRYASDSWLNILGFSLGIAAAFIIALYGVQQHSFDKHNSHADRIVRVTEQMRPAGVGQPSASVPIPVGPTLRDEFPHLISSSARLFRFESPLMFEFEDQKFNEQRILFADQSLFELFDFKIIQGKALKALDEPNQIVISESLALKYFNTTDAAGKLLRYDNKIDLKVTTVIEDIVSTSHFQADAFISFGTLSSLLTERQITSWFWNPSYTYLLLENGNNTIGELKANLDPFMKKYFNESKYKNKYLDIQPLKSIHLRSAFSNELEPSISSNYLRIIILIGVIILGLVIVNFVNMATARALQRAKEIGIRKVLGSWRWQIIIQFLVESWIFTTLCTAVGVAIALISLPWINSYLGLQIAVEQSHNFIFYLLPLFIFLIGLLAGVYPAIYLSAFKPVLVLKGKFSNSGEGMLLRRLLVTGQFVITIGLISASLIVARQFEFMRAQDIGFDRHNVFIIPVQRSAVGEIANFRKFKERLERENGIKGVTAFEDIVGKGHNSGSYTPEGASEPSLYPRLFVREDFVETLGLKVLAGKSFTSDYTPSGLNRDVMINESMVNSLGWGSPEQAIGKKMGEFATAEGVSELRVMGVVKDFNFVSLHKSVGPLVLEAPPTDDVVNLFMIKYIGVKVDPATRQQSLKTIEKHWADLSGGKIFEYSMLDDELEQTYGQEQKLTRMSNVFSMLAIIVSCLGLLGLAAFMLNQRVKEISIRKVLGCSVSKIAVLLSTYFSKMLLVASSIAVPLAYIILDSWLNNFAYHIELEAKYFLAVVALTFAITFMTIAYQTFKAASVNPAKTLRE
ncbi:MAG TPA: ABC transporter permease [Chryseosolibacter sp.]